jgi:hypothetical protein
MGAGMTDVERHLTLLAATLIVAGVVITYAALTLPQRIFRAP